jgi:apolipoprotein N-acyltransferase
VLQSVAVVGIYGLGVLTVLVAALPAVLRRRPGGSGLATVAAGLVGLAALFGAGVERLSQDDGRMVPNVLLRLVQPNIDQSQKWVDELRLAHFRQQLEMSARPSITPVTAVIWAETAVQYDLSHDGGARSLLAQALPQGSIALVGGLRASDPLIAERLVWNSIYAVDGAGSVIATYDKAHLVPFGEYVPFRGVLPIDRIVPGRIDFVPGSGPRTVEVPGLPPFSPLVCYEVIFPEEVVAADGPRPQWLLNVTNDGWYGLTAGPHQHFAIAQTRAVEQGLPLVRVANTGISGIVDPYGRITTSLALGTEGIVDAPLPAALARPTPYAQWGDGGFWLLVLLNLAIGLTMSRRTA